MKQGLDGNSCSRPAGQAASHLVASRFDQGRDVVRDYRGRFGTVVCVNGHDRCFYGPSLECPYCEIRSGTEATNGNEA